MTESADSPTTPCPDCHGGGTVVMSTCCGRGCATCPGGDAMLQAVPCWRCKGRGQVVAGTGMAVARVVAGTDRDQSGP